MTLDQLDNQVYTDLIAVPTGYNLEKAGLWSYSEAYLLVEAGATIQGNTAEVYVFDNLDAYHLAGCNLSWVENRDGNGQVTAVVCESGGSNCTSSNGGKCLTKCRPAA